LETVESCPSLPTLAAVIQCRLDVGGEFEAEKLSAKTQRSYINADRWEMAKKYRPKVLMR
jgi:hypothetical protein